MANTKTKKTTTSTRKSPSSSKTKRKVNSSIASSLSNASGINKSVISKGVSKASKLSTGGKILVGASLVLGIGIGYLGINLFQKNDSFRLVNGEHIEINKDDSYELSDLSSLVVCVSYSRNVVSSVSVSIKNSKGESVSKVDTSVENEVYTLKFSSSDIKYQNVTLTQVVTIVNGENSYNGNITE